MASRFYIINKKKYKSVTSYLSMISKGEPLLFWAANCAVEAKNNGLNDNDARKSFLKKRNEAADFGSTIHNLIEQHIKARIMGKPSTFLRKYSDAKIDACIKSFLKFENENVKEWIESEKSVFFDKNYIAFAGTLDIIVKLKDEGCYCLDIKTSNNIYPEMIMQLAAYRVARCNMEGDFDFIGKFGEYSLRYEKIQDLNGIGILHLKDSNFNFINYTDYTQSAWLAFSNLVKFVDAFENMKKVEA